MTNIDRKVTLILNLNRKLKNIDFYIDQNKGFKLTINEQQKAKTESLLICRVLTNLNYLNY